MSSTNDDFQTAALYRLQEILIKRLVADVAEADPVRPTAGRIKIGQLQEDPTKDEWVTLNLRREWPSHRGWYLRPPTGAASLGSATVTTSDIGGDTFWTHYIEIAAEVYRTSQGQALQDGATLFRRIREAVKAYYALQDPDTGEVLCTADNERCVGSDLAVIQQEEPAAISTTKGGSRSWFYGRRFICCYHTERIA